MIDIPNWCSNDLRIEGELKEVEKFKKENKGSIDFNDYIPYPKEFEKKVISKQATIRGVVDSKDGYNSGGYEWCIKEWGTKWNCSDCKIDKISSWKYKDKIVNAEIAYHFDTAWSPPIPVIIAMSKKYPKLKLDLRYFECGAGYNGILIVEKGKPSMNEEGKYYGERGG